MANIDATSSRFSQDAPLITNPSESIVQFSGDGGIIMFPLRQLQ